MPCTTTYSFFWFERAICPVSRAATGAACTKSDDCESGICRYPNGCAASLCAAN